MQLRSPFMPQLQQVSLDIRHCDKQLAKASPDLLSHQFSLSCRLLFDLLSF